MQCQTVLPGTECTFWTKNGCVFQGNTCQTIVDECEGCGRIVEGTIGKVCSACPSPSVKWKEGLCNLATHRKVEIATEQARVNPIKASKKAAGK
ncbi:MAG TPA: PxxKW family cysteine-rich protein [Desulfuromonadales bacterium]|nr:PxxKW family cysteine-rich protein [Desulfuromonadales bacterium]